MNSHQMELTLEQTPAWRPKPARSSRLTGARWWFAQMRIVAGRATDWRPARPARPEQVYMAIGRAKI